jgi:hypothetical protein
MHAFFVLVLAATFVFAAGGMPSRAENRVCRNCVDVPCPPSCTACTVCRDCVEVSCEDTYPKKSQSTQRSIGGAPPQTQLPKQKMTLPPSPGLLDERGPSTAVQNSGASRTGVKWKGGGALEQGTVSPTMQTK